MCGILLQFFLANDLKVRKPLNKPHNKDIIKNKTEYNRCYLNLTLILAISLVTIFDVTIHGKNDFLKPLVKCELDDYIY